MQERFIGTTRRKVSHFILSEEGRVGSRSAFTAAAVVSVASLATMLFGTVQKAHAAGWCNTNPPGYCALYCCDVPGPDVCTGTYIPFQNCTWMGD